MSNLRPILIAVACTIPATGSAKEDETGWSFAVSGSYETEPAYTGSDTYVSEFSLETEAEYRTPGGTTYFLSLGEAGLRFAPMEDTFVQVVLEYEPGRENGDDEILAAFDAVEDTYELQLGVGRQIGPLTLGGAVQIDALDRGKGVVWFVGARYGFAVSERLSGEASLDISFADAEHMNTEVGITDAVAAKSGLDAYDAPGGYKGTTLGLGLDYALTDALSLIGTANVEIYGSNMTDSPLIDQEGEPVTYEAGIGLAYRF